LSSGTIVDIKKNIFISFFIDFNMIYSPELPLVPKPIKTM